MNIHSQILIDLLERSIHNQKPVLNGICKPDWKLVYEEAKAHQVHTILYPTIQELPSDYQPETSIKALWHTDTMIAASKQLQHAGIIKELLHEFQQEAIPVVILKGLVLRNYYVQPELRTMTDSDILVRREDLKNIKTILLRHGYIEGDISYKHQTFYHECYLNVEVHWTLFNADMPVPADWLSDSFLNIAQKVTLYGSQVLILPPDEQMIHLLMHTAGHLINNGFGLRQLCDLTLYTEAYSEHIHWDNVKARLTLLGLNRYATSLFNVCHRLFRLAVPAVFYEDKIRDEYIELLIDDIIAGGVYGKRTSDRERTSRIYKYVALETKKNRLFYFFTILNFLFPSSRQIGNTYAYARKHPLLLPFAWIHRAIHNIHRKTSFSLSARAIQTGKDRAKLLRWLQFRE